jgi:hypothetical protein
MTQEELQKAARRQPFEPFRIILTTGATYDIQHPDLIMVGKRSAVIGVTHQPDTIVYDYALTVDLFHIVGIQQLVASSPPSSNGPSA